MGLGAKLKSLVGGGSVPTLTLASGTTAIQLPDDSNNIMLNATATVTISTINDSRSIQKGRLVYLYGATGTSNITLSNNDATTTKGQMDLNGANVTLGARDVVSLIQRDDGAWDLISGGANELSASELGFLDGVTAGTPMASKALILDSNKGIGTITSATITTLTAPTTNATNVDAGASGTAGTVDVFPTTASKGKLSISCTDQTGDTTVSLIAGAMAAARTITLADPLADADILTGKMSAVARTATADGTGTGTIADAGMIQFVSVTASDANHIIVLPTPTPGRIVIGYVGANGHELRSSTPASVAINGGSGAAAESAISANMMWVAICTSATSWHGFTITGATLAAIEAAA